MSDTNQNQLAIQGQQQTTNNAMSVFSNTGSFESATRMASALAKSEIVPKTYQGNVANTLVALEMANRMGVSPLMVMQNLDIIHGRPSFNSKFTVAMINATGKYTPIRYRYSGEGDSRSCVAYCTEVATGEKLEGPAVSIGMAKKEGWYGKQGSKWPTMPDLMLSYRAAAFWSRLYEPGVTMGMHTSEEIEDIGFQQAQVQTVAPATSDLNTKLQQRAETIMEESPEPPKAKTRRETPPAEPEPINEAALSDDDFLPD
jgi:hypothetical protein